MLLCDIYAQFLSCTSLTTDSRSIKGGEMFVALKGENFDGNQYALSALESGAACAVVDNDSEVAKIAKSEIEAGKIIPVENTLHFLWDLARMHRREMAKVRDNNPLIVFALTGTNGKTTTKELIKTVLCVKYNIIATEGNLNNNIGVPLTLLRIKNDTQIAVIEMGASHLGDIKELTDIAEPDFGLITNVGKGHLLGFQSFEGVKNTKAELYDCINDRNRKGMNSFIGKIFVNKDDSVIMELADRYPELETVHYGLNFQSASLLQASPEDPFLRIQLASGRVVETQLVGGYNAVNVLAAMKVGQFFGVSEADAANAIASYCPTNNRSQLVRAANSTLIVDAYNANPSSMNAALDNFNSIQAEKKIVLLGGMRELGNESDSEHVNIMNRVLQSSYSLACFVGEEFLQAIDCLDLVNKTEVPYKFFKDSEELKVYLQENIDLYKGATILIKGSRGNKMEKVIPVLISE